jgi:putative lipoprotein (rSAM/lipoprotein system)
MKVRINRWYQAVLTVLLSMLGFESCSHDDPGTEEYGTPYVNYIIKGTVTDEAGKPIPGIEIFAPAPLHSSLGFNRTLTDESGTFGFSELSLFGDGILIADDIDGEANGGEFKSDTLKITEMTTKKIEDGKGWYGGKYEADAKFKLQKK